MSVLDDLKAGQEAVKTAVAAAVAKIHELAAALSAATAPAGESPIDPAAVEAIAQELKATAATLGEAVNPTPAPAPEVPVEPAPEAPAA